jgi:hypothetical protein
MRQNNISASILLMITCAFLFIGCSDNKKNSVRMGSRIFYSDSVVYKGESTVANCLFTYGHNIGCKHMEFSCGEFGQAEIALSDEDLTLWDSMIVLTDDGLYGRQDYYDGLFEITYEKATGTSCSDSLKRKTVVPRITGFRLIALRDSVTGQVDTTAIN